MEAKLQAHQAHSLFLNSHHLPHQPPRNHEDCQAFQQVSSRLIGWDQLYAHRTGNEHMFQNYYDESLVGPELVWAVYPQKIYFWIPGSVSLSGCESLLDFSSKVDGLAHEESGEIHVGVYQPKQLWDDWGEENPRNPNEISGYHHLGTSQLIMPSSVLLPSAQRPPVEKGNPAQQYEEAPQFMDTFSSASSSLPNLTHKRLHFTESPFDSVINLKRQKIVST